MSTNFSQISQPWVTLISVVVGPLLSFLLSRIGGGDRRRQSDAELATKRLEALEKALVISSTMKKDFSINPDTQPLQQAYVEIMRDHLDEKAYSIYVLKNFFKRRNNGFPPRFKSPEQLAKHAKGNKLLYGFFMVLTIGSFILLVVTVWHNHSNVFLWSPQVLQTGEFALLTSLTPAITRRIAQEALAELEEESIDHIRNQIRVWNKERRARVRARLPWHGTWRVITQWWWDFVTR